MASLARVILDFQSGELSRDEFVARLDSALATEQLGPTRLLEMLYATHSRSPLPDDLYLEVRRRIELLRVSNVAAGGEETGIQTTVDLPSLRSSSAGSLGSAGTAGTAGSAAPETIKGIGDTLNNRFVLEECLGVGGMGTVYKALDLRKLEASDRKPYLAIKVLNVQFRGNPNSLVALQREARKAQVLAHRNIITVYDFDRDGPIVYLTMEYLSGKPLSQLLRTPGYQGMPVRAALPIVRGMCAALAYAHERGFVHCDFKPANVFLTTNAEVKVIDFGIARVFQRPEEESDATVFDPGSLGALTPAYASPEMIEHREPDPRDDIYALGCITYELLTGHHPFDRLSATQARNADFKPQRPPNLDTRQWRALRAALSFDRNARMPSVVRFIAEFDNEARAEKSGTLAWAGLAGLAVVCAVTVGVFAFRSGPGRQQESEASGSQGDQVDRAGGASAVASSAGANIASTAPGGAAVTPTPAPQVASPPAPVAAPAPKPALTLAAITPALAQVPCSALSGAVQDHALTVRGFVSQRYGSARLKETLAALPGVDTVSLDVRPLADDKCDVVKTLSPYMVRNWQAGHVTSLQMRPPSGLLTENDSLVVDLKAPPFDSYATVDYYQLDGHVVHMVPSHLWPDNQMQSNGGPYTIGSAAGDWIVSKPFGSEMVVLVVTPVPLFDKLRPESEARADYLRALETRLKQIGGQYGQDRLLADFAPITTRPAKP
ncbi:serine/threonine protein kinase [Paraburkholderia sp. UYCP14C]|uniref:serine/threonine-protein kinase n=1 Tax=Paraburkholderia sp. UYCP14C TaxID=2511130 RepID=UPI001021DFD5|nr:serine/threonine-protein kinase [Paraburkholderia sp. UYCP14C]RZF26024.1 serine/threonine protein kinase [Paraburkholderia sp. UYCP14C]